MPLCILAQKVNTQAQYYAISKNGKYGYMDATGKIVIELKFDDVNRYNDNAVYENNLFPVKSGSYWGYCNLKGEIIIPCRFADANPFKGGLALVRLTLETAPDFTKNMAFIDISGKQVTQHNVYDHNSFGDMPMVKDGLIAIREFKTNKWGFLDTKGKVAIPFIYNYAMPFSEGLSVVQKGSLFGYIDKSGKEVIGPQYLTASSFKENLAVVMKSTDSSTFYFIDKSGKITGSTKLELGGNLIEETRIAFYDGLCRFTKNGKTGLIDKTGKIVVEAIYDKIYYYMGEGHWLVKNEPPSRADTYSRTKGVKPAKTDDAKPAVTNAPLRKTGCGYIDNTGKLIMDIKYYDARNYFYGFAAFCYEKDKWGVMDMTGKVIVEPIYKNDADISAGGLIRMNGSNYYSGEFGYVDKNGKWIWPMPEIK